MAPTPRGGNDPSTLTADVSGWVARYHAALWVALATAVVVFVGPWRETPIDDDWAYARTVEHLLLTGRYRLHGWLSANPFVHVWGGALASTLLGSSFASLRIWTLVVSLAGAAAFHRLAREQGLARRTADVLTLVLVSC